MIQKKQDTILFLVAHNDDQAIGAGGTLAKYSREGKKIVTVIFSFGEFTHPHLKKKVIAKTRVKESLRADKILGGDELYYLGLKEGNFSKEIAKKDIPSKVKRIIENKQPVKIFTHSIDDPHPDHKAAYRFVMDLVKKMDYKGEVYSFNVWNFFINFRKRDAPKLIVDISETFRYKVDAIQKHKSQKIPLFWLMWNVYFQAIWYGLSNNVRFAEIFLKEQ